MMSINLDGIIAEFTKVVNIQRANRLNYASHKGGGMSAFAPKTKVSVGLMVVPGFGERLKLAIGDEAINAFAKKAGVGESLIRNYIKRGTTPGLDKVIVLAETANVSLDWLILGKGEMRDSGSKGQARDSDNPELRPGFAALPKPEIAPILSPPSAQTYRVGDMKGKKPSEKLLSQLNQLLEIPNPTLEQAETIRHLSEALRALRATELE
jgi:transcriptional regulator with XRE-family HTH domain